MLSCILLFVLLLKSQTSAQSYITFAEFAAAVTSNGYPAPTQEQYTPLVAQASSVGRISSKQELAMFLAQVIFESDGLRLKREYMCALTNCPLLYRTPGCDAPGQYYYGRGYFKVTWCYNYQSASQYLFGDNRLVSDPDMAASNEDVAWGTALWFWYAGVRNQRNVNNFWFGATTRAINGALECDGPLQSVARQRFQIYLRTLNAFNLNVTPIENGCYN